jgi:septal ring factor EnvC (AmiA/AmiB activator)
MDETDFDGLSDGASPQEAKRLRKLLSEWCRGDENSFPVQLALLTRAQWRAAAKLPQLLAVSRQQMEQTHAEHRRQTSAMLDDFADTMDAKTATLEQIVATHTQATTKTVAEMNGRLAHAEAVAKRIGSELEDGVANWQKAKSDFDTQRDRLAEIVTRVNTSYTRQEWLCVFLILAVVFVFGVLLGMRAAR